MMKVTCEEAIAAQFKIMDKRGLPLKLWWETAGEFSKRFVAEAKVMKIIGAGDDTEKVAMEIIEVAAAGPLGMAMCGYSAAQLAGQQVSIYIEREMEALFEAVDGEDDPPVSPYRSAKTASAPSSLQNNF